MSGSKVVITADAAPGIREFERFRAEATGALQKVSDLGGKMKGILAAVGIGLSVNAVKGMIDGSIEAAAGMHDLSIQTGASVASLMAFKSVASTSETTIDGIGSAMNKLAKGMAVATEESAGIGQAVKAIGLDFNTLKAMSPDQQMLEVAKALDQFQDGAGKSAVAMTLFGKEGAKMLPFLGDLAGEAESVTAKLTEQQVQMKATMAAMADDFSDNLTKIKKESQGWKKDIAMGMLPALYELSGAFYDVTTGAGGMNGEIGRLSQDGTFTDWTRVAITGVTYLSDAVQVVARVVKGTGMVIGAALAQVVSSVTGVSGAISHLVHGEYSQAWDAMKNMAREQRQIQSDALGDLGAMFSAQTFGSKLRERMDQIRQAGTAAKEAKKALNFDGNADGSAAAAAKKEAEAYAGLISSIRAKSDENRLELVTDTAATEGQKLRIKVDQELASGKLKLSEAHLAVVRAALDELDATEELVRAQKAEKDGMAWMQQSAQARNASNASLQAEYEMYGKSADAREIAMVAVKGEADLEKFLQDQRSKGIVIGEQLEAQLQAEKDMRVQVEQATLAQTKALGYANQLAQENKKFAAESISDPRAREQALLKIDADIWQERIRLAGEGTDAQKSLQKEFDTWYANRLKGSLSNVDLTQAHAMLDIMSALDESARSAAQGMAESFGSVGSTIGKLTTTLSGYGKTQAAIAAQLAAATKGAGGDQAKIHRANTTAAEASAQAQMRAYGDMAGAAKSFFDENSKGYQVLNGVEKAYRAAEMVMALESMTKKIFFKETEVAANTALNATKLTREAATTAASTGLAATEASAWGVTAVVKAIASMPFPLNLAAGAATLAAVIGVGAKLVGGLGGGSVSHSEQRQKDQGTGTVFGDKGAKSDSIARSIELSAANSSTQIDYLSGMLSSLKSIESSMSGFTSLILRTTDIQNPGVGPLNSNNGGATTGFGVAAGAAIGAYFGPIGAAIGAFVGLLAKNIPIIGKIATSIFGGKQSVEDSGFTMDKATLSSILASGVKASQFAEIKTSGGWFSSDKYSTKMTSLGADANAQFTLVLKGLSDSVTEAASLLGVKGADFTQRLDSYVVDIGMVSLKGKTGEEIEKELSAVFSKVGDQMATAAGLGLDNFAKAGEGPLETLTRIAADYAKVDASLQSIGMEFGKRGLESVAARESLIDLMGGIDKLQSSAAGFASNFLSKAEQLAPVAKYVDEQLASFGQGWIKSREDFKNEVLRLSANLSDPNSQKELAQLMGLQAAFAATHAATVDLSKSEQEIADERKDLLSQLDELTMSTAQLRAKARAEVADENKELYDHVQVAQSAKDARALEIQIMGLSGDKAGELAANRALELAGMDDALQSLQKRIYALQDEDSALQTHNSLLQIQAQIYDLTGDKVAAAAVLEEQHAIALAALDPALRGATEKLWGLQAAAKASEQMKADASMLLGDVDSAESVLEKVVAREKAAIQASVDAHAASVTRLQSLAQALHSTLNSMQSPDQQLAARAVGQAQIRAALAIARAGGPLPDSDSLKDALSAVQSVASGQFGSYADYLRDLYQTQSDIGQLAGLTDDSLSVEQQMLDKAKDQLQRLDDIVANGQELIAALKGQSVATLSLADAMAAFQSSIGTAKENPVVAGTAGISSLYQQLLGRAPDQTGLQFWQDAIARGTSLDAIRSAILDSDEYKKHTGVLGYASGGMFGGGLRLVGENGPELEVTGPARIWSNSQTADILQRASSPSANSEVLVSAVNRLNATVALQQAVIERQEAALKSIAISTMEVKDRLIKFDVVGMPPERKE